MLEPQNGKPMNRNKAKQTQHPFIPSKTNKTRQDLFNGRQQDCQRCVLLDRQANEIGSEHIQTTNITAYKAIQTEPRDRKTDRKPKTTESKQHIRINELKDKLLQLPKSIPSINTKPTEIKKKKRKKTEQQQETLEQKSDNSRDGLA